MLCSNCGYENPSEHRYCGMCGTPFPYRALTVPGAQSTLEFIAEPASEGLAEAERSVPTTVTQAGTVQDSLTQVDDAAAFGEKPGARETFADVPESPAERWEAMVRTVEIPQVATTPQPTWQSEAVEPEEPTAPAVKEPEQPVVHPAHEPDPEEPEIREPEPEAPEVIREPPLPPEEEPETPPPASAEGPPMEAPKPPSPQPAAPRAMVMPPPTKAETPVREVSAQEFAKIHPPPDSLPLASPPASSGMPTFKEVAEASGPPTISPFEPPKESHTAEDRELEEFVASFHWTPPAETADELTMRSEVPVIDKEAPAEFHHPSFDGDEAPPSQAGPHPTGKEYYAADGTAPRTRFLDVGKLSDTPSHPASSGSSILGIDATPSIIPAEELARTSRRRWLWGSIVAVVAIFGGLGYLEGRAQSTHEFRGPVEIAREGYTDARQWLRTKMDAVTAAQQRPAPEPTTPSEPEKQTEPAAQPVNSEATNTQQDPTENTSSQPKDTPLRVETPSANTGTGSEPAATAPPKPIEAPPAKLSTKLQPGQQELAKAMQASDAAATAAWLWKATSRGNPDAPVRLADMYLKGNGVPKSCEQALVLLRAAAIKENAPARNRLAALYANGTCVARDPVKAYQLMSSAMTADSASDWAKENRQVLWNQMTPQQRAEAEKAH